MPPEYLTTGEFTRWTEHFDKKIDRVLDHIEAQTATNLTTATELAALKVKQDEDAAGVGRRTTIISSAVSAFVGGLVGWLTGGVK